MSPRPTTITTAHSIAGYRPPNMTQVAGQIAYEFCIDAPKIFTRQRTPRFICFRWACYLATDKLCEVSPSEMARYFYRNHSTITSSLERAEELYRAAPDTAIAKHYPQQTFIAAINATLERFKQD